jgi:hypothetical protein
VLQNLEMKVDFARRALPLLLVGVNALWALPAHAVLGGNSASVLADAAELQGVVNSVPTQQYDIQEITTQTGMHVREYLTRAGSVFAVSWAGPALPDLQQLLGTHFAEYTSALAALNRPGLHRSARVALAGLVVESGGHLRAYAGRAYLPALIPAGVPVSELR